MENRSADEWVDLFRDVLWSRIRRIVDGGNQVAVALSGGLDSSTIACIAADIAPGRVHAITYRLPGDPASDELRFARAALSNTNVQLTIHNEVDYFNLPHLLESAVEPDAVERFAPMATAANWAKRHECAALLVGTSGDIVGGYDGGWQMAYAREGRWKELWASRADANSGFPLHNVLRLAAIWGRTQNPAMSDVVRMMRYGCKRPFERASIVDPEIENRLRVVRREFEFLQSWENVRTPLAAALQQHTDQFSPLASRASLSIESVTGIPLHDPFADPDLFRVACSVPWELRHGALGNRILLRLAGTPLVPVQVRNRRQKCHYAALYGRLFRKALQTPELVEGGNRLQTFLIAPWREICESAASAQYPILEATYRVGLVGAWLNAHGCGSG